MATTGHAGDTGLLTVNRTARRLGLSRGYTYRLVRNGTIPSLRIGGAIRVDPVELDRWLAAQRTDAA